MSAYTTPFFFVFWPKNAPTQPNLQPAELVTSDVTASSPLRFLVQKALKTANSEKCVFSCPASNVLSGPPSSLVFRRKPAPGVRRAPNSAFCPEKPANSSPLNSSPLVTALSPLAFWVQKCAKPGPVPELLLRRVFCGRQPAEDQAQCPTARRGGPSARRACHH